MLTSVSQRNVAAARPARSAVVVRAQAKPEVPKETLGSAVAKVASHALASAVSAALLVSSVAPSAVQAAVPIQNQGDSIEVAFNFGNNGPTTEAARDGPVKTAQKAADKLNNVTNGVFGDVPQKGGASYNNNTGSSPNPSVTKDAFGRDINKLQPVNGPQEAIPREIRDGAGAAGRALNSVNIPTPNRVAFNLGGQNPIDAAKNAADKVGDKAQEAANKVSGTAKTPVSQRPNFQDAQDSLVNKFKGNNSSPGKPQTNKFAQLVAFGGNPGDVAREVGNKAQEIGQSVQNKASSAANAANSSGLLNITNKAQDKLTGESNKAKGVFNNVKQAATQPVSQRPNLQDAQNKLFPNTGNNSTPGKPQVTKDVFGRDISQLRRVNGPGEAIPREIEDGAGAAGRALNAANIPTPGGGIGNAVKNLANKAQNAASNITNNV